MSWLPEQISPEVAAKFREAIALDIHDSFRHVTRVNAVSWSEADVIDDHGTAEEREAARASDKDTHWSQLVENNAWRGTSNWSFLDPGGFRYYLPAGMILVSRGKSRIESLDFHLQVQDDWGLIKISALTDRQCECVARFCVVMCALGNPSWMDVLNSHWKKYLPEYD